jgi:hypothetical protein
MYFVIGRSSVRRGGFVGRRGDIRVRLILVGTTHQKQKG